MIERAGVPRAAEWIAENDTLISRRGHRIAFRRRGVGPTVLLLHGFPTWSYDYAEVASDLARDHDVITLDFLGYGASEKPNPYEYSVAESADTVEDLTAQLDVKSVRLMSNNPSKFDTLRQHGIPVCERVALAIPMREENERYIKTKQVRFGHYFDENE